MLKNASEVTLVPKIVQNFGAECKVSLAEGTSVISNIL